MEVIHASDFTKAVFASAAVFCAAHRWRPTLRGGSAQRRRRRTEPDRSRRSDQSAQGTARAALRRRFRLDPGHVMVSARYLFADGHGPPCWSGALSAELTKVCLTGRASIRRPARAHVVWRAARRRMRGLGSSRRRRCRDIEIGHVRKGRQPCASLWSSPRSAPAARNA